MINQFIKGKVCVFVDVANLFYAQRTLKWRISYKKLKQYFERECGLEKIFAYTANDKNRTQQQKFLRMLKHNGFIVRTKPVKKIRLSRGVYEWKGDFDIEIAIDMLDNIDDYDTLVLLSGDSDFAPIIDRVKEHGKNVIVISTKGHVSRELLERSKYINLKKLRDEIELLK